MNAIRFATAVQANTYSDDVAAQIPTDSEILEMIYPVGSVYISVLATNPATLLGMGIWSAITLNFVTGSTTVYAWSRVS